MTDDNGAMTRRLKRLRVAVQRPLVVLATLTVVLSVIWLFRSRETSPLREPSIVAKDFLARLPTEPLFHVVVVALIVLLVGRHWYMSIGLRSDLGKYTAGDDTGLSRRDWWVVHELRKRALGLRARADCILFGVFTLLFGGFYVVLFVVPHLHKQDVLRDVQVWDEVFLDRFGQQLRGLVNGTFWIKVNEIDADVRHPSSAERLRSELRESVEKIGQRGAVRVPLRLEERATGVELGQTGESGLIGTNHSVLMTENGGLEWSVVDLELRPTEWIIVAGLSRNGSTGLVAGDEGSTFLTNDGGENWRPLELGLLPRERMVVAEFSGSGSTGLVAGDEGSTFLTEDGGENWRLLELELLPGEGIVLAEFSENGEVGLIAGDMGSAVISSGGEGDAPRRRFRRRQNWVLPKEVSWLDERVTGLAVSAEGTFALVANNGGRLLVTIDAGQTWTSPKVDLLPTEWIDLATMSRDGTKGLVAGDEGSVFLTSDAGATWTTPPELRLARGTRLVALTISGDGRRALAASDRGDVLFSTDGGESWSTPALSPHLTPSEWPVLAAFNQDGDTGLIVGDEGSVVVTKDGGVNWDSPRAVLSPSDWITMAAFDDLGMVGLISGDHPAIRDEEGLAFFTTDGGDRWSLPVDNAPPRGRVTTAVAISARGQFALVASSRGSVLLTSDGGGEWSPPDPALQLSPTEWVTVAAFSEDGRHGLIAGDEGSVFVTRNSESRWLSTQGIEDSVVSFSISGDGEENGEEYFARAANDDFYVLKSSPGLEGWQDRPLPSLVEAMSQEDHLRGGDLLDSVRAFAADYTQNAAIRRASDSGRSVLGNMFSDLRVMQVITLTVLFLLVNILVRLHNYSLRLAAFWESRCDAVVLAQTFSKTDEEISFDALVRSLAPDKYDLKPPPSPRLGTLSKGGGG